jgi:hypothetical protein
MNLGIQNQQKKNSWDLGLKIVPQLFKLALASVILISLADSSCAVVPTATEAIRATKAMCTEEFEDVEAIPLVVAVEAVAVEAVDEVVMVRAGIEVVEVHDEV